MRRYDKYKDSGIEWIGEIPEHWESIRLKYIGYLYGGLAGKSANDFNQESNFNNKPFIPFTNICNNKIIDPNQLQQVVIEENEQQNQVAKGDLFFMMSSENFDDVGKSSILLDDLGETYLNSFCKGFRFTKKKYYPPFVNYQLLSKAYRSLVLTEANGYTRINLKIDKINDIPLKTPPTLDEQIAIANYLDKKTAEIDELIKQKEELLLLFEEEKTAIINHAVTKGINPDAKLKDSGIDWLGDIPEHWEVKKLKYIGKSIIGIIYDPKEIVSNPEQGILVLRASNIQNGSLSLNDNVFVNKDIEEHYITKIGDILICSRSGSASLIGKNILIDENSVGLTFGAFMTVFRTKLYSFIYYYFNSQVFKGQTGLFQTTTINQLTINVLNSFMVAIPPDNEQSKIVDYIKIELDKIDVKLKKIDNQILLLKEYKSALISEVATGKVKVI